MSIRELREAVEAGERREKIADLEMHVFSPEAGAPSFRIQGRYMQAWQAVLSAYADEDLNASRALHDALLPGLPVKIVDHSQDHMGAHGWYVFVNWPHTLWMPHYTALGPFSHRGIADNPARAWLLAILRALEQEGRDGSLC